MKPLKTIALSMILAAGCTLSAAAGDFLDDANRVSPMKKKNHNSPLFELQKTFNGIYNVYQDSVVFISTEKTVQVRYDHPFKDDPFFKDFFGPESPAPKKQKRKGLGTGFIISRDGFICTNYHVVENMDSVTVQVKHKSYKARIIGSDKRSDIALLKIDGDDNFRPVYFGDSDKVRIGDMVIAIGNPFGLDKTLTSGIVSATSRRVIDDSGMAHIQTDASINPGNSGGPLINLDGEVIGVNRMIYSQTGGSLGIGFAIPANLAKETLVQLKKYGKVKRGYIGVQLALMTPEIARQLGLAEPRGALINAVISGGPAEKAGLRVKDIVTKIDGQAVQDYDDLRNIVSRTRIGKTVKLSVWRDSRMIELSVTIAELP